MKHPEELIARSLDGDLTRDEAAAMNAHLATCAACRELAADLRHTEPLLSRREEVTSVPVFSDQGRPRGIGWLWVPIALAAAVVAATIVALPRDRGVASPSTAPTATSTIAAPTGAASPTPVASSGASCSSAQIGDIKVCPASAPVGGSLSVSGRACNHPGQPVELYFGTSQEFGQSTAGTYGATRLGTIPVAADGTFSGTVTVPSRLDPIQQQGGGTVGPGLYGVYTKPDLCRAYVTVVGQAPAARFTGFYLRAAAPDPNTDLNLRRRVLVEADGVFPGRVIDDTVNWYAVGAWAPNGSSVLAYADNGDVYVVAPGAKPRPVVTSAISGSIPSQPWTFTQWSWIDDRTIATVRSQGSGADVRNDLVEVDAGTGAVRTTDPLPRTVYTGSVSPAARYIAYVTGGGDTPPKVFLYDVAGKRERVVGQGQLGGWLDAERLVVWNAQSLDVVRATDLDRTVLFSAPSGAFVSASPQAIVALDGSGVLWVVQPDGSRRFVPGGPINRAGAAAGASGWPTAISADGRVVSFDETTTRAPAPVRYRAAIRDLDTGDITYACDDDCIWLRIR